METKINIAEILRNKPYGIKLYSPIFGECIFCYVREDTNDICVKKHNGVIEYFNSEGLYFTLGEVMLFPSKEMRDWSKFFKYGDILVNEDGDAHIIFVGYDDYTYKTLKGNYYLLENEGSTVTFGEYEENLPTSEFNKANKENAQEYICKIEKRLGGKLNRETLEIEKTQPEFKDGDIVFEEGNRNYCSAIGVLKKDEQGCFMFDTFLTKDKVCYNSEYIYLPIRLATEEEKKQFFSALEKEGKAWDSNKKQIIDLKPKVELKPFDRVLVRDFEDQAWQVSLFSYKDSDSYYCCNGCSWNQCIPYIGNESLLCTTKYMEG